MRRFRAGLSRRLGALRHRGSSVECPVCEKRFRRFADAGSIPAIRCPACASLPRHRLLWLHLVDSGLLRPPASILHLAPEAAIAARLRSVAGLRYLSADLEPGAAMVQADLTGLPFGDETFDLVLCSHVLEHVPADRQAMREMRRVLRAGGTLLVQTPVNYEQTGTYEDVTVADPAERLRRFSQSDHVRVYGPDLRERLEEAGFAVRVLGAAEIDGSDADRHGLLPALGPLRNDLYECRAEGGTREDRP